MSSAASVFPEIQSVDLGPIGIWSGALNGTPVAQVQDAAREIEQLGYSTLWYGEAPSGRDTFTQALMLLGATERLVVATGIANIYLRDASIAAAGARTIAALHPGRFVLGLGASHGPLIDRFTQREYGRPLAAMRAYLDGIEATPLRTPEGDEPGPPVVLAALGPKMLELARDRTHGAHPYLVTPEHTRIAREAVGPDRLVAVEQGVVVTDDREVALRRARTHLEIYQGLPNYRNSWLRLGFTEDDLAGDLSDRLVEALIAWGDEDAIYARVAEHRAAGADHVCLQVLGDHRSDLALDGIRRLAPARRG